MISGRHGEADRLRVDILIGQMDVDTEAGLRSPRHIVGAGVPAGRALTGLLVLMRL